MRGISALWKANIIVFISSFCVMVIELIAARMLAPYIGVSLYTWTSIIGVILAGIALGNYLGGKIADRYPSPLLLVAIFFTGSLTTIAILPFVKLIASADLFNGLPIMLNIVLKTSCIFFIPSIILSMVSPLVIKLTLADVGQTGGVVGTIYAFSTVGAILGTFMTGFYFILWFGTRTIVWLIAVVLLFTGVIAWLSWKMPGRWKLTLKNFMIWTGMLVVIIIAGCLFLFRDSWQEKYSDDFWTESYSKESNYYTIRIDSGADGLQKAFYLDEFVHNIVIPDQPMVMTFAYLRTFEEIIRYVSLENPAPVILYLGGGGYSLPRYMEIVYPSSVNDVIEIDPLVTQAVYEELGLPRDTSIKTYNQDARFFLIERNATTKYDIVVGDVFNDKSTPYHLTTLEFNNLVKANMSEDGIYMINIVDDYHQGRYLPSLVNTLKQSFKYVYVFSTGEGWEEVGISTFVIAATDYPIDTAEYNRFITDSGATEPIGRLLDESKLETYLAERKTVILTDDYAPTDIFVAPLFNE